MPSGATTLGACGRSENMTTRIRKGLWQALGAVALMACGGAAQAALVTVDSGYGGPVIDLSSQASGSCDFSVGPLALPGMSFTSTVQGSNSGQGSAIGRCMYGLGHNGDLDGDAVFIGLDGSSGALQFMLTGAPVASFGAYVNYAQFNGVAYGDHPIISAVGADGNVLESYDLQAFAPIDTAGGLNEFAFRGIERASADIHGLWLSGGYIVAIDPLAGPRPPQASVEDIAAPVPEPGTYGLMLAGLAALVLMRRRAAVVSRA